MYDIHDNIKLFRKMRGLSQRQLADLLHTSVNTITNYECGVSLPNVAVVAELCKVLNVTPNEIFGWDQSPALKEYLEQREKAEEELKKAKKLREELDKKIKEISNEYGFFK